MNVPLRALSWATRFFWIIALAFAATCIYSATLIRANFGEPAMTFTEEDFTVALPVVFDNRGYYSIADLNATTVIADYENRPISKATSFIAQISPQNNITTFHTVTFNINQILTQTDYLFSDSNFTVHGSILLNYAGIIPLGLETNKTIPWGAPLFNFTIGNLGFSAINTTHLRLDVPVNFENHSPYLSVVGTIRIEVFNDGDQLLGEGAALVNVPYNAIYDGEVETFVNAAMVTGRGQIRVYVETEFLNYGPLVVNYG